MIKEKIFLAGAETAIALTTTTSIPALATCLVVTAGITKGVSLVINKLESNYKK